MIYYFRIFDIPTDLPAALQTSLYAFNAASTLSPQSSLIWSWTSEEFFPHRVGKSAGSLWVLARFLTQINWCYRWKHTSPLLKGTLEELQKPTEPIWQRQPNKWWTWRQTCRELRACGCRLTDVVKLNTTYRIREAAHQRLMKKNTNRKDCRGWKKQKEGLSELKF